MQSSKATLTCMRIFNELRRLQANQSVVHVQPYIRRSSHSTHAPMATTLVLATAATLTMFGSAYTANSGPISSSVPATSGSRRQVRDSPVTLLMVDFSSKATRQLRESEGLGCALMLCDDGGCCLFFSLCFFWWRRCFFVFSSFWCLCVF